MLSDSAYRLRTQVSVHARFSESRLRLFQDEASNIGSQLIGMTLLQQEDRVNSSAKKAGTHQGEDGLAQGSVDDTPVEGMEPGLVQRGNKTQCLLELVYFTVATWVHRFSLEGRMFGREIFHRRLMLSMTNRCSCRCTLI